MKIITLDEFQEMIKCYIEDLEGAKHKKSLELRKILRDPNQLWIRDSKVNEKKEKLFKGVSELSSLLWEAKGYTHPTLSKRILTWGYY